MVSYEMVFIPCKGSLDKAILLCQMQQSKDIGSRYPWRFPVIRKIKDMNHVVSLLLFYNIPAFRRNILQSRT